MRHLGFGALEMIFGHANCAVNENGLLNLQDVSLQADAACLRALANFLKECADEIERGHHSQHWHRHCPAAVAKALGGDFIVTAPEGTGKPSPRIAL